MVGACEAFKDFEALVARAAASDATILITGESGSGKGLAAETIHRSSARAGGPFLVCSLAALAPSLVEAELFGHEEGAFTGAHKARRGRFRQAEGGTMVLDDIDTLPLDVQVKLLRVLQERVVEPLGSDSTVPLDVRVVATTGRDLRLEVEAGRFRTDLYYRLAVVPIAVPPLRERTEDLPRLCEELLGHLARRHGFELRTLSTEALERLAAHPWPGNVRELENTLERVLVLSRTTCAEPIEAGAFEFLGRAVEDGFEPLCREILAAGLTLEELERKLIEVALRENRGNKSAAARQIGLTRRALEYRMRRFDSESGSTAEKERPS